MSARPTGRTLSARAACWPGGWFIRTCGSSKDQAMSALLADLQAKGLLDQTLVVLGTEFGRTPRINDADGRDHHNKAFTCLLAGAGIKGGQAYGKTDGRGAEVEDGAVRACVDRPTCTRLVIPTSTCVVAVTAWSCRWSIGPPLRLSPSGCS